jgi:hypothetical protein
MFQIIRTQLQRRAELLLVGRYEDLTSEYRFPMPIYMKNKVVVIQTGAQMLSLIGDVGKGLRQRNVRQMVVDVTAVELPKNGRLRVWATWEEFGDSPEDYRTSEVVYFGRMSDNRFVTEACEYSCMSMPDLHRQPEPVAKSA